MGEEVDMEVEVVAMEATVEAVMVGVDMEIMEEAVEVVEVAEVAEEEFLCHSSRWNRS